DRVLERPRDVGLTLVDARRRGPLELAEPEMQVGTMNQAHSDGSAAKTRTGRRPDLSGSPVAAEAQQFPVPLAAAPALGRTPSRLRGASATYGCARAVPRPHRRGRSPP